METTRNNGDCQRFIESLAAEFPGFRLVPKDSDRLSHWIDRVLRLITLGGQREYLTRYHTVIGYTLYVPASWNAQTDLDRLIVLRHERIHLLQRRRLGLPLMTFLYLVPILPLGLAWGRARIEWEAYTETLRATAELKGLEAARSAGLKREIVGRFTGPAYGWMWPFPGQVESWYEQVIEDLSAREAEERPRGGPQGPLVRGSA